MANPHRPRAIIYIPTSDNTDRAMALCLDYCERHRYRLVSVVTDDPDREKWAQLNDMLISGRVEVIVVLHRTDVPADRVPRVDAVGEEPPQNPPGSRRRSSRPRRLDR